MSKTDDDTGRPRGGSGRARHVLFYRTLLRFYPKHFRSEFGPEMEQAFVRSLQVMRDSRGRMGAPLAAMMAVRDTLLHAGRLRLNSASRVFSPRSLGRLPENLWQDIRLGWRGLRRSPGFALVAVLTLALAIGANTAVFSAINAVVLSPLPYREADRLVRIWGTWDDMDGRRSSLSDYDFVELRRHSRLLEQVVSLSSGALPAHVTGEPGRPAERLTVLSISAEALRMLGVDPIMGRHLSKDDRDETLLLSHEFWQRRYGGDPSVVGESVLLHGVPRNVAGVLPAGFRLHTQRLSNISIDAYRKFTDGLWTDPNRLWLRNQVLGRLKPGVTLDQLQEELKALSASHREAIPSHDARGFSMEAQLLHDEVLDGNGQILWTLLAAVALVLMIACGNVGNLLLMWGRSRQGEFAIRSALGGSRGRIARQVLTESALLGAVGTAAGVFLASAALPWLISMAPGNLPRLEEASINLPVLFFSLAATALAVLLFGLLPALRTSALDPADCLSQRNPTQGRSQQRLGQMLIVGEVALSLMLLAGAGLFLRSFHEVYRVPLGFEPGSVLTFSVALPGAGYSKPQDIRGFYQQLEQSLAAMPGVQAVGSAWPRTLGKGGFGGPYSTLRDQSEDEALPMAWYQMITPGYLQSVGTRLKAGRFYNDSDERDVVIIDESLAQAAWPDEDPLGKHLAVAYWGGGNPRGWARIIGVVENVRHSGLTEESPDSIYLSWGPWSWSSQSMTVHVRTAGDPLSLVGPARQILTGLDPDVPLSDAEPLYAQVERSRAPQRFLLLLVGLFAALGLVLASVGLYGLVSFGVNRRQRELGIRIIHGAGPRQIFSMVLSGGLILALAGIGLGLLGTLALSRLVSSLLFNVAPTDPLTIALMPLILLLVVLAACYRPARRATRVDPAASIRSE